MITNKKSTLFEKVTMPKLSFALAEHQSRSFRGITQEQMFAQQIRWLFLSMDWCSTVDYQTARLELY